MNTKATPPAVVNPEAAKLAAMVNDAVQAGKARTQEQVAMVIELCGTDKDKVHALLCATIDAAHMDNGHSQTFYDNVRDNVRRTLSKALCISLGLPAGSKWSKKTGFGVGAGSAGKVTGKEKGKTGEQAAIEDAMGKGGVKIGKVNPMAAAHEAVAVLRDMLPLIAQDARADILASLAKVAKGYDKKGRPVIGEVMKAAAGK